MEATERFLGGRDGGSGYGQCLQTVGVADAAVASMIAEEFRVRVPMRMKFMVASWATIGVYGNRRPDSTRESFAEASQRRLSNAS